MGRKGFKGPKDPFADLTDDFKDAIESSSREEIERRIAKVAMDDCELRKAKKDDQDLKEKAEAHAFASAVYRDGFKMNKIRIEYMKRALDDKGGPTKAKADANGAGKVTGFGEKLQASLSKSTD